MPSPCSRRGRPAGDDIDQQTPIRHPVEPPRSCARRRWRLQAGPHRHQITQPLGPWRHGGGDHPGILQLRPRGQQHAEITELIGRLRRSGAVIEVTSRPPAVVPRYAVAMVGQEQRIFALGCEGSRSGPPGYVRNLICFGISPSAKNVSATCWLVGDYAVRDRLYTVRLPLGATSTTGTESPIAGASCSATAWISPLAQSSTSLS